MGLIVSRAGCSGFVVLKKPCLPKPIALAVVAINEPPIFNWAFAPKIIPLGLIKNKLVVPLVFIIPSILETVLPVTRLKIFLILGRLLKKAVSPLRTENFSKL